MIIRCGEYAQMGGVTTGLLNIKAFLPQFVTEKKKYSSFHSKRILVNDSHHTLNILNDS